MYSPMKKYLSRRLGVSDDPTVEKPSLHDCIEAVLEVSGQLLDDVLNGLELTAGNVGSKSSKVNQRGINRIIVASLRHQGESLRATFGVQLRLAIYRSGSRSAVPEALVRFDDLQMLDEAQLQANIEFAMAQQEIQSATDEVIAPLNALISSLMGWMSIQAHLNPLRPETFARALRETLFQHVSSEQARSSLMAPAAGVLGSSLRDLYRELADWLKSQGIEPVVPLLSPSFQGNGTRMVDSPVARTMLTLDKLRRLLNGELDQAAGGDGPPLDFTHTVPASVVALEDLRMVEPMMKRLSARAQASAGLDGRQPPGPLDDGVAKQELGRQLGEEVVRLLMDNLAKDLRLLPPVRAQVKELEPLLLKLAQDDHRFFSNKRHPARRFLDRVTHQSLGFKTENDERFQAFIRIVSSTVLELLDSGGVSEAFDRALGRIDGEWARIDQELKGRQEEAARALMHAEQRNMLAHRLAADFVERIGGKKMPDFVSAFLLGPWAQVVAQAQLRQGGGEEAEAYLAIVDELVWSAQPRLTRGNRQRLVQLVPGLLVKLRQGLQQIEYPPEQIPRFFDELIALHERAFEAPGGKRARKDLTVDDGSSPSLSAQVQGEPGPEESGAASDQASIDQPTVRAGAVPDGDMDAAALELTDSMHQEGPRDGLDGVPSTSAIDGLEVHELSDDDIWMGGHEAYEAGYLPQSDVVTESDLRSPWKPGGMEADLALGSWVELQLKGEWVRAQLTWASPHRTLFMFISGRGLAHSMSRRTMEQLRQRGLIRVVSERHMVDSALDAVAQAALLNERKKP